MRQVVQRLGRTDLPGVIVALLIVLALAAPCSDAWEPGWPPAEGTAVTEAGLSDPAPLREVPAECPLGDAGCTVCIGCCRPALHASSPRITAEAGTANLWAAVPTAPVAADPGCSVWHPPRG